MYKRLLTFLMLFAVSPVNLFADDTAGNASMSGALVINPGAGTANCSFDVLGTESGLVRFNARFVPNKYTVTYVAGVNGSGAGITDRDIEFERTNYTIRTASEAGITSNAGYHFVEWSGASNDPLYMPNNYNPGDEFNPYNIADNLILTAWHDPNKTNIHYVCGAQAGTAPADDIATYGESFTFAENTCDLFGHNFDYWSCVGKPGTTGLNAEYASGEVVNPWSYTGGHEETIICTAQWSLGEYAIHYLPGGGTGNMANTYANYGQQNVTLRQNAFAKDKHFFNGWNCVDESGYNVPVNTLTNNGTNTYRINEMPASDVYCTAQWDQYNITYYGCIDSLETCTGDNRIDLNSYFPEKTKYAPGYIVTYPTMTELSNAIDGYVFNGGWYFNTGASAGTSTEIRTGNLTLYTVMKPLYSVSYRCNESQTATEQGKYTKDSGVMAKTNDNCTPESGYSFDVWDCNNGVDNVAQGETFTMPAGDVMCTAVFTPNDYVLKYDCNIPQQPKEILYSDNLHVNENVNAIDYEQCENAGYEFSGWNCNNGVGNVAQGQEFTMPANDVTCIAEIEKMQFTLSYECENADSDSQAPASQTGYYLDVLGLAENTCEKTGSTFTGWHCSDGTTYNSGDTIILQANTVCRSQWDTNRYSVTYECGEGALGNPPVDTETYEFNASVTTKLKTDGTCQKTGGTFANWKCGNVEVAAGSDFNITHDTTCVAQWSDNTYKLTYKHGLHGTGADYVENVVFGTEHTVLTADDAGMTANDGYEFDVWDCGMFVGNKYPNDTITMPANDVTCTAQWKLAEYVIRYRTDEGSGSMSNTPANYGQQNVTLRQNAFVNDYHFFNGWNCVADKDNSSVTVNTVTNNGTNTYKIAEMPASDVTCTAKWDYYSITYYGCVDSLDNCTGNNRIDLSSNFPAKTKYAPGYIVTYPTATELNALSGFDGYTFNGGWYFDTGASAGTSTEIRTGNLILYTVMTQDKYTITYKPGNAGTRVVSGENKVRKVVYGGTQYIEPMGEELKTLSADTFSIVGYTFDKWLSNKNVATGASANVEYDAEVDIAPYNVIGNTEMTAQWMPNHYKVTYIIGGDYALAGPSVVEDVYDENTQSGGATYDARYDIIVEANTAAEPIDGYVFAGWTTDSTPSFTNGALNNQWNGETIWTRDNNDLTVYAAYKPKSYTISYNCGTGTTNSLESVTGVPPAPQDVEYMGQYELAENENECVLPGAYFIGWRCDYDLDNGYSMGATYLITEGGDIVEKNGSFIIDDDVTCSALWHDYKYDVTYDCGNDADEGSVAPTDDASYYYMHNAQAKDNLVNGNMACVRKNYDFDGWNCGGVDVNVGANFVVTQDTTCVARWAYICCDADNGQYLDTETGTCKTKPEHSHLVDNMCSEGYECDTGYKLTDDGYCEIDEVEINFVCGHGISRVRKGVYGTTETAPGEELCCDDGYCEVYGWNCDNDEQYDVGDGVAFLDGENLTCLADIEFNIRYKVYTTNDGVNWNEVNQVVVGGNTVNVSDLQPDKYRLDVHVAYPQISLQGYTFEGWYDYFDGEGFDDENKVTMTPDYNDQGELWIYGKLVKRAPCVINYHNVDGANNSNVSTYMVDGGAVNLNAATKQYYRFNGWHLGSSNGQVVDQIVPDGSTCGIDLYAEWEFECNEKGHEHWLHVGDGENDKICLYENRPYQNAAIVVVKGTNADMNYYMMLSSDQDVFMHEGSNKKLRVMNNGTPYNACDMSTCAP